MIAYQYSIGVRVKNLDYIVCAHPELSMNLGQLVYWI